jgi:hypothetical protein
MEPVNAVAEGARVEATAAQATATTEDVQAQLTQVQKQTSPEVPLGSLAKEVQPEVQPEPTANEDIPAATVDMAALIATLQTMQHGMQQTMQQDMQHMQQDIQQTMQNAMSALQMNVQTQLIDQQRSAQAWLQSMEERGTQEQRTVFVKVEAKVTSVGTGLEELANNAHKSHLVVQDLKKKMEEQEQRVGTMNTAISTMILTRDAKSATVTSLPAAAGPPAKSLPTVPEPVARKYGPRSSAEQAKRGEYLQSAVHYAVTALAAHKHVAMRTGFSRWASCAYATKLQQKRKITGDAATKLEGREQAYAEQVSGPEENTQATTVQARLAAAWTYHEQSYAQAGMAEPMVKAWKQTHASTEVSKANL